MDEKIKDGGPAFPVPMIPYHDNFIEVQYGGMSLRDWIATTAKQSDVEPYRQYNSPFWFALILCKEDIEMIMKDNLAARWRYADAMLDERNKRTL